MFFVVNGLDVFSKNDFSDYAAVTQLGPPYPVTEVHFPKGSFFEGSAGSPTLLCETSVISALSNDIMGSVSSTAFPMCVPRSVSQEEKITANYGPFYQTATVTIS